MKQFKLNINTKTQKYPIIIGRGLLNNIPKLLKNNSLYFTKCLIVIDNKIKKKIILRILKKFNKKNIITFLFNANEKNKNQKNVDKILAVLLKNNFQRNDCLISVGGGITGDVSGFASSIYKRGINFVNIPTTLLAQVDSSIGGKTGINTSFGKNLIGSFYQPKLVISDIDFLKTLPKREIVCGYAEIFKHSLIFEEKFFSFLDKNANKIINLKSPFIEKSIIKSCEIKKKIVELDEKEKSLRKILNFGHTFAHAYESSLNYSKRLNHGEAVLLGIYSAISFSLKFKLLSKLNYLKIKDHFIKYKLPNKINNYFLKKDLKRLIYFMKKDKKNTSNLINLILIKKIGIIKLNLNFNEKVLNKFFKEELNN
tara:strand:- start:280 stop:1386 length:1107 start_codon:yes stop_codon:yes gene_type:complete